MRGIVVRVYFGSRRTTFYAHLAGHNFLCSSRRHAVVLEGGVLARVVMAQLLPTAGEAAAVADLEEARSLAGLGGPAGEGLEEVVRGGASALRSSRRCP